MPKHIKTGIKGEQIAADFLLNKGYIILHRNWRYGKKEVDIIALEKDIIIFVEVKTRTSYKLNYPEESVTLKKRNYLKMAAEGFSMAYPQYKNFRFDIISVLLQGESAKEIMHFEDAFH